MEANVIDAIAARRILKPNSIYSLRGRLAELDATIPVAMVGAGAMGRGLLHQLMVTPAFRCVALADVHPERAVESARSMGIEYAIATNLDELNHAIEYGQLAICEDADLLAETHLAEIFIDASNAIAAAGLFCSRALEAGKHLIMMNAEADLAFGPYFLKLAREHGVVYASCDGDQHGVIKRLVDDLQLWGFELVMAGNIKGFLNRYADPTTIIPEADKRNLDYRMCAAYTDGTKLCIEMAILANALGLKTAVAGMYGPKAAHARDALNLFRLEELYREHGAIVDYVLGAEPNGGVFAIGYCDDPYQRRMMEYYKMGDGPFYVFYRPYHLCHVEAMEGIADAYLDKRSLLQPDAGFRTDVYAYAKRDMRAGDVLDGIGGYACYGLIENCDDSGAPAGLPMTIAEDVVLKRDVLKDERISLSDVEYDENRIDFVLYNLAK